MDDYKRFFVFLLLLVFSGFVFAHSNNAVEELSAQLLNTIFYAFAAVLVIAIAASLMQKSIGETGKKIAFVLIAAIVILTTLYVGGSIVSTNLNSVTGGPVHWHADYEIWACGEKIETQVSEGFENKVGTQVFHHHNDNRIHVEGVVLDWEDVMLGEFFEAIGGEFTKEELTVILHDGTTKTWANGDSCPDGHAGTLKLYANGAENEKMDEYVISPYSTIPPGDVLKIVFD